MVAQNLFTSQTPAGFFFEGQPTTLSTTFYVNATGKVCVGGRFYAHTTLSGGTYEIVLWDYTHEDLPDGTGAGTVLASATFSGTPTAGAWNSVTFSSPVALTQNHIYRIGIRSSVGRYGATGAFWASSSLTNGAIVGIQGSSFFSGQGTFYNGVYQTNITGYPNQTFNNTAYFVDPTVDDASSTTPFTRDYASTWRVFNAVTRDYVSTWRVLNAFTRDYSGTWRVLNALTADYASTWRVFNSLTRDYSSVWRVLNSWTTDYTSTWRVLNSLTRDYPDVWRVLNGITRDYPDTWRVFNAFARDYASTWDVLSGTAFVRDYQSTWRVFNTLSADYSSTWRVFGPFARDYTDNWRVLNGLTRDYASTWRVFRGFTRDYSSTWAVLGETPDGLIVQVWSGSVLISVVSVTIWDGTQEIPATIEDVTG